MCENLLRVCFASKRRSMRRDRNGLHLLGGAWNQDVLVGSVMFLV